LTIRFDVHLSFHEDQDRLLLLAYLLIYESIGHHSDYVKSRDDHFCPHTPFVRFSSSVFPRSVAQTFSVQLIMLSGKLQKRKNKNKIQAEHLNSSQGNTMYLVEWFCLRKLSARSQQTNPQQESRTSNNNSCQGLLKTYKALRGMIIMHFLLSSPLNTFKITLK
jgi:hypothetical protein